MSKTSELLIVGSGPAGYTAGIYAARAQLQPTIIAGSISSGGALMNTTDVENFPGFPEGIMGPDLMEDIKKQAERFGANIILDDAIKINCETKAIATGNSGKFSTKAMILAMGSGFKRLEIPGEDRLSGHGVSWCATCDGFFFREKTVAVIGGGDSALEEALFLTKFATHVYIIHRRDTLRASKIMQERAMNNSKCTFLWNKSPVEIYGESSVCCIKLEDTQTHETSQLDLDGIFIAIGHEPRSELVAQQILTDDQGYVLVNDQTTRTNIEGVFACGDLVDHRYRQAITAAGTGCMAALDAEKWLAAHE